MCVCVCERQSQKTDILLKLGKSKYCRNDLHAINESNDSLDALSSEAESQLNSNSDHVCVCP